MSKLTNIHIYDPNGEHELDLLYKNIIDNPEDLTAVGVYADKLPELNCDLQAELCWTQFKLTDYIKNGIDGSYWHIKNPGTLEERTPHLLTVHNYTSDFCPLKHKGIECQFC